MRKNEKAEEIERYVDGLKRFQEKGVALYVDGFPAEPEDCAVIFNVREDGMFYMGDYIETPGETDEGEQELKLTEIHFDKVYHS